MVDGQRHRHHRPHDDLAVDRDRPVDGRADGEDRRLRRVEHGGELLDAEHAEVRDRERAALEVGELQSLPSRALPTSSPRAPARSRPARAARPSRITGTTSPCGAATAIPTFADGKRRSASSVNWTFTSGWRISARAQTFASRSVTVTRTSGLSSRERSSSAFAWRHVDRDGQLEDRHLPGLGQPAGDRRRMLVSGTDSTSPGTRAGAAARPAAGRGAASAGAASARSTSSATIRPSGPVPVRPSELDAALARHPPRERRGLDAAGRLVARAVDHRAEASAPRPRGAAGSAASPRTVSEPSRASEIGHRLAAARRSRRPSRPTGTSPSATAIASSTPLASASTSWVALSVSTS